MKPTQINFALEAYRRDQATNFEQICRNWYAEKDSSASDTKTVMLLQRPGLDLVCTLGGPVQAVYSSNNAMSRGFPQLIVVAANTVYAVTGAVATPLGTISGGDTRVQVAGNFDRIVIIAGGGIYMYGASAGTTTNSFRQVAVPTPYTAVSVAMIDDYFIIGMSTGVYYWLVPGDDSLAETGSGDDTDPADHFATAQTSPDDLIGVAVLNGNLIFLGGTTIEAWQTTGLDTQPFQRMPNSGFPRGCLARDTIANIDNSLFWVGEDGKTYRYGATPELISTTGIDERVKERTGPPSAWIFSWSGHLFYVLNIPGQGSYAYDTTTKNWTEFASEGYATWRAHVGAAINDTVYCGDLQTGALWTLSNSSTDTGTLIRRTATAAVVVMGRPARNDSLALDIGASASCSVSLRVADADQELTEATPIQLDASAGPSVLSYWRLGQARQPYRQYAIEVTDPAVVRISGARLGDVWQ